MYSDEIRPVNDQWFKKTLKELQIDPRVTPGDSEQHVDIADAFSVDLTDFNFISLSYLLDLFLTINVAQSKYRCVNVLLPGLAVDEHEKLIVDDIPTIRKALNEGLISPGLKSSYRQIIHTYNFLCFLKHFGLFGALKPQRAIGKVVINGLAQDIEDKLFSYSGAKNYQGRVFSMIAVWNNEIVDNFRDDTIIDQWLKNLPGEITQSPIFSEGEFSSVFGYQLGLNIIQHSLGKSSANKPPFFVAGNSSALGAIAMRFLPSKLTEWIKSSFPSESLRVFERKNLRGVLEICVGDTGVGIVNTLREDYSKIVKKFGRDRGDALNDKHVLGFAFDEIGSSKPQNERWGGVHALHRILKSVIKYHGILRIRTHGYEFVYDVHRDAVLARGREGLGILPPDDNIKEIVHINGVQIQILLPLESFDHYTALIPKRSPLVHRGKTKPSRFKFISTCAYKEHIKTAVDNPQAGNILIPLAQSLLKETQNTTIVYDFEGQSWTEEQIAAFIYSQKAVLHTQQCIGINLNSRLAKALRERENLIAPVRLHKPHVPENFFHVLASKQRVFPVYDTKNRVWWLGLGRNRFYDSLQNLFFAENGYSFNQLTSMSSATMTPKEKELLELYLKTNTSYFELQKIKGKFVWHSKLTEDVFKSALKRVIRDQLDSIIRDIGGIRNGGKLFKLPSREEFTQNFIQILPMIQNPNVMQQINAYMTMTLRDIVSNNYNEILLVCATAPSEMLARNLANSLFEINAHIINLGYYSALDEDKLLRPGDWKIPAIIISDIVDTKNTINDIYCCLTDRKIEIIGLMAILLMTSELRPVEIEPVMKLETSIKLPEEKSINNFYYIAKVGKPKTFPEAEAIDLYEDHENRLFVAEPFSLETFNLTNLQSIRRERLSAFDKTNIDRTELLEKIGALRYGHWVYGRQHFRVTLCTKRMHSDDRVGGAICGELIELCLNSKIDHILTPLHSDIGDLVPRLLTGLKVTCGRHVGHSYLIATKAFPQRGFYVLTKHLQRLIEDRAKAIEKGEEKQGLRLLILDEVIASGRSLETILRAIIRAARKAYIEYSIKVSPIYSLSFYSIMDRRGRASGTIWTGIRKISLVGDDYIEKLSEAKKLSEDELRDNEPFFYLNYDRWIVLDLPVQEKDSCSLCSEISGLQEIRHSLRETANEYLVKEIETRINEITPRPINVPSFVKSTKTKLPIKMKIGRFEKVNSMELFLWEFYNLSFRGYPYAYLINIYSQMASAKETRELTNNEKNKLEITLAEMTRVFFVDFHRMVSEGSEARWIDELRKEVVIGSYIARKAFPEAGRALAVEERKKSRLLLINFFNLGLDTIAKMGPENDKDLQKRDNLTIGCLLFCNYYKHYIRVKQYETYEEQKIKFPQHILDKLEELKEKKDINIISRKLLEIISQTVRTVTAPSGSFIPHLINVMNNTLRAKRSFHPHLIPAWITKIKRREYVTKKERDYLAHTLHSFIYSLKYIASTPYVLNDEDAPARIKSLENRIDKVVKGLNTPWPDEKPPKSLAQSATRLKKFFPHQSATRIFQLLEYVNIPLGPIIEWIEQEAKKKGIICDLSDKANGYENLTILAPSEEKVQGVLKNYLFDKTNYVEGSGFQPRILVVVDKEKVKRYGSQLIELSFYTDLNLEKDEDFIWKLERGPGIKELDGVDFKLFEIDGKHKIDPTPFENYKYPHKFSIRFLVGYSTSAKEN